MKQLKIKQKNKKENLFRLAADLVGSALTGKEVVE